MNYVDGFDGNIPVIRIKVFMQLFRYVFFNLVWLTS